MNSRDLMQAKILLLLNQLHDNAIEEILATVRRMAGCTDEGECDACELNTAAETCKLLLTMDKWERKGYLRWMKAKYPEAFTE
jgi:hypothetical protein